MATDRIAYPYMEIQRLQKISERQSTMLALALKEKNDLSTQLAEEKGLSKRLADPYRLSEQANKIAIMQLEIVKLHGDLAEEAIRKKNMKPISESPTVIKLQEDLNYANEQIGRLQLDLSAAQTRIRDIMDKAWSLARALGLK